MKTTKFISNLANLFNKKILILLYLLILTLLTNPLKSAILTVPGNYPTIQTAIDSANEGDEIIVSQGKYHENLKFKGKNITLRSTAPLNTNVVEHTIIDGNYADSVIIFSGSELPQCVLSGFTIKNGWADDGGGIYGNGTRATIKCNIIESNYAKESYSYGEGGGIYDCDGAILNNTIFDNAAADGGGLANCDGFIQNNFIIYNLAFESGGGLSQCNGFLLNNTIADNLSKSGGGMVTCQGLIINCIFWLNYPQSFTYYVGQSSLPFYSCLENWDGSGIGNISTDPMFVDPDNFNYHLKTDSSCVDKGNSYYIFGNNITDIDIECRIVGVSVDMGCDEVNSSLDTDGDLLSDNAEFTKKTDPINPDSDNDGLIDGVEVMRGTPPTVYNIPSGISVPNNYNTIQQALFIAFPDEIITVSPATYNENLCFLGKNVILQSENPDDEVIVDSTILDGGEISSVIFFLGTEDETCALKGFTIQNGAGYLASGITGYRTTATIENNKIVNNNQDGAVYIGGGIYQCNGLIRNNTIANNLGTSGFGLWECEGLIENNIITNNAASGLSGCDYVIRKNTITSNKKGALCNCDGFIQNNIINNNEPYYNNCEVYQCDGIISNNLIVENIYSCDGFIINNTVLGELNYCDGMIINCIIWSGYDSSSSVPLKNSNTPLYSCITNWSGGGLGNISDDPLFQNYGGGDYHLQPSSPCINKGNRLYLAGDYIADLDKNCRIIDVQVDMGCYEVGSSSDIDGDLLPDDTESSYSTNQNNPDTDGDGLSDGIEIMRGTDPMVANIPTGILIPNDFPSVQQSIFYAFPGETITVSRGTYNANLFLLGKNLVLTSTSPLDEETVSQTILYGGNYSSVINLCGLENETCVIRGFTIQNGKSNCGGGISGLASLATIEYNKIINNSALSGGGVYNCDGLIRNNVIKNNTASANSGGGLTSCNGVISGNIISENSSGGGLYGCSGIIENNDITNNSNNALYFCDSEILNNRITNNSGIGIFLGFKTIKNNIIMNNSGGGVRDWDGPIINNVIAFNSENYGGGLYYCRGNIENNTIFGNIAQQQGGGAYECPYIKNCIVWGNSAPKYPQIFVYTSSSIKLEVSYSCIQDWDQGGTGNISNDPQFVDAENGDFHLTSISPCIDAGGIIEDVTTDIEGNQRGFNGSSEPRGDGSDYDIGAYEFYPRITKVENWNLWK